MFHGVHHAFPQDRYRIAFPPIPGNIFIFVPLIVKPLGAVLSDAYFYNFFGGFVLGYMCYELCHYSFHHTNPTSGIMRDLKLYHMQHHYKFGTVGFGVSSKFWDVVFRTTIPTTEVNKKAKEDKIKEN